MNEMIIIKLFREILEKLNRIEEKEHLILMSTTDPLSPLNASLASVQTDLVALQASNAAVLAYLKSLTPGTGVSVDPTELATAVANATAIDTALQSINTADVAAVPPPNPTTPAVPPSTPTASVLKADGTIKHS